MPPQIRREDVRNAIAARSVPQTFEQIARMLESSLNLPKDSVSPQSLSRTVRSLVEGGHVVTVTDQDLLTELGAFPKKYWHRTKFFLAIEVARERIDAKTLRTLQEATQPAGQDTTQSQPTPEAAQRKPPSRKVAPGAAKRAARPAAADQQPRPEREVTQERHLRAVTAVGSDRHSTEPAAAAPAFAPAFSAATNTSGPDQSVDQVLDGVATHVAGILIKAAAMVKREAEAAVLHQNQRWHKGEFGPDGDRAAAQLQALYDMVQSNVTALKKDAKILNQGAARLHQAAASTATG